MKRAIAILFLSACANERADQLEARLAELKADHERLSRDLADLRKTGTSGGSAAPVRDDRAAETLAILRALLERDAKALPPPSQATNGTLPGAWRSALPPGGPAVEEVLHLAESGMLCGYRLLAGAAKEKQPFWGRWERHGNLLVTLHDRWVGDHNEHDAQVRAVQGLSADSLQLDGQAFTRVDQAAWPRLASTSDDRIVPIPGLPKGCFGLD